MASNITPVTSLPWLELFKVKVRTSAARSITTPSSAVGLGAARGFLVVMAARYTRNAGLSNGAELILTEGYQGLLHLLAPFLLFAFFAKGHSLLVPGSVRASHRAEAVSSHERGHASL